eukprot:8413684-Pyramimonas_sp.AAC.1
MAFARVTTLGAMRAVARGISPTQFEAMPGAWRAWCRGGGRWSFCAASAGPSCKAAGGPLRPLPPMLPA